MYISRALTNPSGRRPGLAFVGGLGAMMGWMTYGSRKWEHLDTKMRALIPGPLGAMRKLIPMIDADTNAFNGFMDAMRLPKDTEEQKKAREATTAGGG